MTGLWGPFFVGFVYQAINVVGYVHWSAEERRLESAAVGEQAPAIAWAGEAA